MDSAPAGISPLRHGSRDRFRAGWALFACAAAIALSSCSAGPAADMTEPLVPSDKRDSISASGPAVISEKGTGTGTYAIEGGLKPGDAISMSASCVPGEDVTISSSQGPVSSTITCSNPASGWTTFPPATAAVPVFEITVETDNGGPFWLMAWVHDAQ